MITAINERDLLEIIAALRLVIDLKTSNLQRFTIISTRLIGHLNSKKQVNINSLGQLLEYLGKYTIGEWLEEASSEIAQQNLLEMDRLNPVVIEYFESIRKEDDREQQLMRVFLEISRKNWDNGKNPEAARLYSEVRSFINPDNYLIPVDDLDEYILELEEYGNEADYIEEFYEECEIPLKEELPVCPVCGKALQNKIGDKYSCLESCHYYKDIERNFKLKKIDITKKYKVLKEGIYRYTLIPGISELRIAAKLSEGYGVDSVELYPEVDRFDILLKYNDMKIYLDVKDYNNPYKLAEKLKEEHIQKKSSEVGEGDHLLYVVPEHVQGYKGNYLGIVKRKLKEDRIHLEVIREDKLYQRIERLVDEY